MRLLADTHAVLWALLQPGELGDEATAALRAPANVVLVSAASAWEIAIKEAVGKLRLPRPARAWLPAALERTGFDSLDVSIDHALAAGALPAHHRDPFDRMLVAQALEGGLTVVTRDPIFARYGAAVLPC